MLNVGEDSAFQYCIGNFLASEIITELILERAGPAISKTFLLELISVRLVPVIFLQDERSLKITGKDN